MGVMTVSSQNFMEIDMPGWWLSGASVDLDLRNGRYYDSSNILAGLSNLLSISRASIGYARTSGGVLTQFSSGQFRQTDLGLLIEDARTNLIFQSADFTTTWTKGNSTVTGNSTTAPDGTATADTLVENVTGAGNSINCTQAIGITANTNYAFSCFLKASSRNYAFVAANGGSANVWFGAVFDLVNGIIGDQGVGGSGGTLVSAAIEPYSNGWFRCTVVGQFNDTLGNFSVGSASQATGNTFNAQGRPTYTTSAGTNAVFMWGAQQELGGFSSSQIPTTTTSATRAADSVTITGSAQTLINNATGSIVAWVNGGPAPVFPANIIDSNGTNLLGYDASDHGLSSITSALATGNTANSSGRDKLGTSWDAAGRRLVLNGGTVATDAVAQTPSATQKLGSASGTSNFIYAYVDRLALWNTKLASATLQSLTT